MLINGHMSGPEQLQGILSTKGEKCLSDVSLIARHANVAATW